METGTGAPRANAVANVALCFAVAVLEGFDIQAIGIAAPRLAGELGLPPDQIGWVFFASNVALVFGAAFGGWLADRIGRKPVFIVSVITFSVFTLFTALSTDLITLFAARVGCGLGFGAALPNMMAIAADVSRPERRALTATLIFCGMPLGGGSVALMTQFLPAGFDWRIIFYVGGLVPLLLVPLLWFFMTESRTAAVAREPVNVLSTLFGQGRWAASALLWIAFFPTLLVLYLILYWLPTLVIEKGFGGATAPQASVAFNYASVVGALLFGWIVDRFGARWPLSLAYAGLIVVTMALATADSRLLVVALSGAAGFFLLGANYALYGVAPVYYPPSGRGTGSGAAVAAGRVGSVIGPLLPGLLLSAGESAAQIINLLAPAAATAGLAVFLLTFMKRGASASKEAA